MLSLLFLFLYAAKPSDGPPDCRVLLRQACQNMTAASNQPGLVMHTQLRTEAFYTPPGQKKEQRSTALLDICAQGNASAVITPLLSTWQDGQYQVMAIKAQRTVIITQNGQSGVAGRSLNPLLSIRDSLLHQGTIVACAAVKASPGVTHLELKLSKKAAARLRAMSIEFWLDTRKVTLQKLQFNYAPQQLQTRTIITLLKQEPLTSTSVLLPNARRQVLTEEGKLRPAYAGYRLVDQSTVRPK